MIGNPPEGQLVFAVAPNTRQLSPPAWDAFNDVGHSVSLEALIQNDVPQHGHMSSLGMIAIALEGAAVAARKIAVTTITTRMVFRLQL
jgi:hypothetical protein